MEDSLIPSSARAMALLSNTPLSSSLTDPVPTTPFTPPQTPSWPFLFLRDTPLSPCILTRLSHAPARCLSRLNPCFSGLAVTSPQPAFGSIGPATPTVMLPNTTMPATALVTAIPAPGPGLPPSNALTFLQGSSNPLTASPAITMSHSARLDLLQRFGSQLTNLPAPVAAPSLEVPALPLAPPTGFMHQTLPPTALPPVPTLQNGGFPSLHGAVSSAGFMPSMSSGSMPPVPGFMPAIPRFMPPVPTGFMPPATTAVTLSVSSGFAPHSTTSSECIALCFTTASAPLSGPHPLLGTLPTATKELNPNIMPIPFCIQQVFNVGWTTYVLLDALTKSQGSDHSLLTW
ncbi:hypothetical protein C0993_001085 [Termitomyces sp. T159_Od127]|nr:hypothetical protein C0993_001085 [Termitomyces sp. T159_Od127]